MKSDKIVVLDRGVIIEQGTHQELIALNGVYGGLVSKQAIDLDGVQDDQLTRSNEFEAEDHLHQEELELKQQILDQERQDLSKVPTDHPKASSVYDHDNEKPSANDPTASPLAIDAYDLKIREKEESKKRMKKQSAPVWKVLNHMRPEWKYLVMGVIGSALSGCVFPFYAFSFSHVISILSVPGQDIQSGPLSGTNLYAFLFVIIGIGAFLGACIQFTAFEICGEKFSKRFRGQVFDAYLKQEIGFFDIEENNTGALTARLAVDARNVSEMITKTWGDVTSLVAIVICSFILAFSNSWALTLIVLCMSPFIFGATAYEFKVHRGFEDNTKRANAESGQVAGEAIREVRTVASLNKQAHFEERYYHATDRPHKLTMKKAYLSSINAGISKGINIYTSALAFYAGARFIMNGSITFQQMFTTMTVIMTASESASRSSTFASAFTKAKYAAIASFEVIEREPKINPELEGLEPAVGSIMGDIDLKNIQFAYPVRPDVAVFNGKFNLQGKAGQTIALVGPSGCGKSSIIAMLQRWYDPLRGVVSLDQNNVKNYSVYNLRSHMALVGQEPVLFDMTINENIRFGMEENVVVTQEQVEEACKAANIDKFISGLPDGYNTRVGDKGSQLSGGQKQRIAIARALVRHPKVLLLDEATSALDSESEHLVQEALDNILQEGGRTTITIAHRLSTIKNADTICVVKDGCVIEQGTHWELLKLNGVYSDMVQEQSLSVL